MRKSLSHMQEILILSLLLCLYFVKYNNVSNLLNQNGVGEELMSTTDENGEKRTLYIFCLYQRMSNVPLAYV